MFAIQLVIASCATAAPCDDQAHQRDLFLFGCFLVALIVVMAVVLNRTRRGG
jgi:hypothetical protein